MMHGIDIFFSSPFLGMNMTWKAAHKVYEQISIHHVPRAVLPYGHVRRLARSEDVDSARQYCDSAMITVESSTNSCEQLGT